MATDGAVTANSVLVRQGGRMVRLPVTRKPFRLVVDLDPCPCGKPNCDRDEWDEMMTDAGMEDDTVQNTPAPLFAWTDANLGGALDSGGKLRWDWSQSEQDWIRTGC